MTTACMGGWCPVRDNCRHHLVEGAARQREPEERLCDPGTLTDFSPIHSNTINDPTMANSVFDLARVIALEAA